MGRLVTGCDCGCRGDYEITDKGLEIIGAKRTTSRIPWFGYDWGVSEDGSAWFRPRQPQ